MPVSKNLGTYSDVRVVLDAALRHGSVTYKLKTTGSAVNFRQRCYAFRKVLLQEMMKTPLLPGIVPSTPYDHLAFTTDGTAVKVGPRQMGELFTEDGTQLSAEDVDAPDMPDDDMELVETIRKQFGVEND
jgi:hypothetical protein